MKTHVIIAILALSLPLSRTLAVNPEPTAAGSIVITIGANDIYRVADQTYTLSALSDLLRKAAAVNKDSKVIVRSSKDSSDQRILDVLNAVSTEGLNQVSLVTPAKTN